jgi:DNA repair exonuclease SbcCD ATPase subunit
MKEFEMNLPELEKYLKVRLSQLRVQKELNSIRLPKKKTVLFVPNNCTEYPNCPFYKIGTAQKDESIDAEAIDSELETIEDASGVLNSFYSITKILSMRDPSITEYDITQENILSAILKSDKRLIVDVDTIQSIRTHIEEYEEFLTNIDTEDRMKTELALMMSKSNGETKEEVKEKLSSLEEEKKVLSKKIRSLYREIARLTDAINAEHERSSEYNRAVQYKFSRQSILSQIEQRQNELNQLESKKEARDSFMKIKTLHDEKIDELSYKIEATEKTIEEDRMNIKMFKQLDLEIQSVQEKFDYISDLKDITSLSDGIPLIHIKLYCRALCTIANEIIKRIYQGDFRIKKFDIREGVFNIPYYTKGFTVKDIRDTSQAESSVAKLAISFAILSQFMTKYNIPLLDEVDGPMHQINKERFFSSIEGILHDVLKCEQAFLITQSTMFNEYPVNFIVTDSEYKHMIPKDATIIFQR